MRRRRTPSFAAAAIVVMGLAGCTGVGEVPAPSAPAAEPSPSRASTAPPAAAPSSIELVRSYVDDVAAGDVDAAYAALSGAAQGHYGDAAGLGRYAPVDGSIHRTLLTPGIDLDGAEWTSVDAAEGTVEVVTVVLPTATGATPAVADAWVVREEDGRPVVEAIGQPPTGPTILSWINPSAGAEDDPTPALYDPSTAVAVSFSAEVPAERDNETFLVDAGDAPELQVPATDLDGDAAGYLLDAPAFGAGLHHVTLLWQDAARGTDPNAWYTSTVVFER